MNMPTILFVDNEEESCFSFHAVFRREYKIHTTTEPLEVSALIERLKVDVILSNSLMPYINGFRLLDFVMRHYPHVKRILITASILRDDDQFIIKNNIAQAIIQKPWDYSEINKLLKS